MRFDFITIFPEVLAYFGTTKIIHQAVESKLIEIHAHDVRKFSTDKHRKVDDTPFGGGPGMVLQIEPLVLALESIPRLARSKVFLTSPQGDAWDQTKAAHLVEEVDQIIFIAGRYEGVDERIAHWIDGSLSIGDFVLMGGELPAMCMIESMLRLIPGVVGDEASVQTDSLTSGQLKYPQYSRPSTFRGLPVPSVLLSGNHGRIDRWRQEKSYLKTLQNRPNLLHKPNKN